MYNSFNFTALSQEITEYKNNEKAYFYGCFLFKFFKLSMNSPSRPGMHNQSRINEMRRYGKKRR